jgi:hypothetical protein
MMDPTKICLIVFLFVGGGFSTNGQGPPKAVLVDEFGRVRCEDLSGRLDVFIAELNKDPSSIGYVAVSSAPELAWRERFIDGYARYRAFDESRLVPVRVTLETPNQTQMWRVPAGAELPVETETMIETSAVVNKPRKYRLSSDFVHGGPCYTGPPFRLMSKHLKMHPEYSGNIAIGSPSYKTFRKARDEIRESFQKDYNVNPSRLRFFWIRTLYDPAIYELWLVRRKSRRVS